MCERARARAGYAYLYISVEDALSVHMLKSLEELENVNFDELG